MRISPLVLVKELIYQFDINFEIDIPNNVEVLDLDSNILNKIVVSKDILDYCIFRINKGYQGICIINKINNELIGYAFYSSHLTPPTNIPRLPKNSGWLFNDLIVEKYRGNGYQKLLISERVKRLKSENQHVNIYTDIIESNIGSRKSYIKAGFKELGVYYIMVLGIRR